MSATGRYAMPSLGRALLPGLLGGLCLAGLFLGPPDRSISTTKVSQPPSEERAWVQGPPLDAVPQDKGGNKDKAGRKDAIEGPPARSALDGPGLEAAVADLRRRNLQVPVPGVRPEQLRDSFGEVRGTQRHEALDIPAPRGTPVLAVEDGVIARLFLSRAGGITIYQRDPTETYIYYYAHLDRYAETLREKDRVRRGQVIGYVGTSGNAPPGTPHLHFAILKLKDPKRWWEGAPINPYLVFKSYFPISSVTLDNTR